MKLIDNTLTHPVTPFLRSLVPSLQVGLPIPPSTASDETRAWAIQQLSTCRRSHKPCNDPFLSATFLPTRLLDVSTPGRVRLHIPGPNDPVEPYAALSHCWGRRPFLRTLSGTLQEHCAPAGVTWERLPPTFRDAADLTRRLGIRYLWIDSLCIVQDDHADWRREASRMAGVYRGAEVTISAARSPGAYGGLFAEVGERGRVYTVEVERGDAGGDTTPSPGRADGEAAGGEPETVHVRVALTHPDVMLSRYHAPPPTLPTFSRGWILQERLLSPRILHFGPEELLFECLDSSVCQCTPRPAPEEELDTNDKNETTTNTTTTTRTPTPPTWYSLFIDRMTRHKHYYALSTWESWLSILPLSPQEGKPTASQALATAWHRLIHDYTRLSLTMERDIFPAVSGMARTMATVRWRAAAAAAAGDDNPTRENGPIRDAYCAGLWRATLLTGDLLWHVELPGGGRRVGGKTSSVGDGNYGPDDDDHDDDDEDDEQEEDTSLSRGRWAGGWPCRPRQGWRAPSWSWASVTAPVAFLVENAGLSGGVKVEAEVLDVVCQPAGEDPMGELRPGGKTPGKVIVEALNVLTMAEKQDLASAEENWWEEKPKSSSPVEAASQSSSRVVIIDTGGCFAACMKDLYVGQEALDRHVAYKSRWLSWGTRGVNWDDIEALWREVFKTELQVNAEEHPLLLTAPIDLSQKDTEKLTCLAMEYFAVPALFVTDTAPLALYITGRTTGLVVDAGHCRTSVVPVYEGFPLARAAQNLPVSGREIMRYLGSLLAESNPDVVTQTHIGDELALREVKEKACSVVAEWDPRVWQEPPQDEEYTLPDGARIRCGVERFRAIEPLFAPFVGLPAVCLRAVAGSDITLREGLTKNMVLTGGTTLLSGFAERLEQGLEQETVLASPSSVGKTSFELTTASDPKYAAWRGGSMLAELSTFRDMCIHHNQYDEIGTTTGEAPLWVSG
ncbi:hypothetical protein VTJ49DRAFT_6168 [Mycothermus thermophilus]|uniref:Heterokaryon incompatibility domain-containing protein n=1 Tax=Humicola insolens TaxID=85995 RepID=A0ABR3V1Q8_HUMIN